MLLQTKKLVLRPISHADIPRQRQFFKDPELAWLDSSTPQSYAEIDIEALMETRLPGDVGSIRLAVEVDGNYVGFCSLKNLETTDDVFELGINIGDSDYWNKGVGRDAIHLLLEYGFLKLGAKRIELTTNEKNPRAIKCFATSGFTEKKRLVQTVQYHDEMVDMIEMTIDAATWIEANF